MIENIVKYVVDNAVKMVEMIEYTKRLEAIVIPITVMLGISVAIAVVSWGILICTKEENKKWMK